MREKRETTSIFPGTSCARCRATPCSSVHHLRCDGNSPPSGLNKWVAENQALEEGRPPPTPTPTSSTDYTITIPDTAMLVDHEAMKAKITVAGPVFLTWG